MIICLQGPLGHFTLTKKHSFRVYNYLCYISEEQTSWTVFIQWTQVVKYQTALTIKSASIFHPSTMYHIANMYEYILYIR